VKFHWFSRREKSSTPTRRRCAVSRLIHLFEVFKHRFKLVGLVPSQCREHDWALLVFHEFPPPRHIFDKKATFLYPVPTNMSKEARKKNVSHLRATMFPVSLPLRLTCKFMTAAICTLLGVLPRYIDLLRSQYWSSQKLAAYWKMRLADTVAASSEIPFYRERLGSIDREADLCSLPVLKRSEIPLLNQSVRERRGRSAPFLHDSSSGSTGMPAQFLFDHAHQIGRYAARFRCLRANGWNPARRNVWTVALTAHPDETPDGALLRSRLRLRTRFVRIFIPFEQQVEQLIAIDPLFLYTLPSNLDGLLRVFERKGARLPSLRRIMTGSEVLDDSLRTRARAVLGVEISDSYGSTEGFIAWQCPTGSYHINAEHVLVEIVDEENRPAASGQMGRVLITTLENRLMPLIRYEIGDYAVASDASCGCGRTLPVLGKVVGRGVNLFRLPGERIVSPWPLVGPLKSRPELRQFQIVQDAFDRFIVRYAAERDLDPAAREAIAANFRKILDLPLSVSFERVEEFQRSASGKFMTALSRLPREA
jgi:phenylacetate-CoA ligase